VLLVEFEAGTQHLLTLSKALINEVDTETSSQGARAFAHACLHELGLGDALALATWRRAN